jgi:gas vesicle protein
MKTDHRLFGVIIGGIVAVAAAVFIFSGGELGGKKTIASDQDLPPVAATVK